MTAWNAGGRLPNDPAKLARYTGCTRSRWAKISADVLAYFEAHGDHLVSPRLALELEKASEKSIKRAVSGSLGGKAKALKTKKSSVANATVLPKHSPEPEPERVSVAKATSPRPGRGRFGEFWIACPRKRGKGLAETSYRKALSLIGGDDPHAVLMAALAAIKPEWAQLEPKHIPHPATWLNQKRWEDEIEVSRSVVPIGPMTPEQFAAWREHATA